MKQGHGAVSMTESAGSGQLTPVTCGAWDGWLLEAAIQRLQQENPKVTHGWPGKWEGKPATSVTPATA